MQPIRKGYKKINININLETLNRIDSLAKENDVSRTYTINKVLTDYLKKKGKRNAIFLKIRNEWKNKFLTVEKLLNTPESKKQSTVILQDALQQDTVSNITDHITFINELAQHYNLTDYLPTKYLKLVYNISKTNQNNSTKKRTLKIPIETFKIVEGSFLNNIPKQEL